MKPAILLVDLQNDYLRAPNFHPAPDQVVARVTRLLQGARALSVPVIHIWTTVRRSDDRRMPHWKRAGKWSCVEGTDGHATPEPLRPLPSELVVHKTFFTGFEGDQLERALKSLRVDTVILAGVYLHACVRSTAFDAYQRGYEVWIAEDAVGGDDPLHAAVTQRFVENRAARLASVESCLAMMADRNRSRRIVPDRSRPVPAAVVNGKCRTWPGLSHGVHVAPGGDAGSIWKIPVCAKEEVAQATAAAAEAFARWQHTAVQERVGLLKRFTELLAAESATLARRMAVEVGKPIALARQELVRSVALLEAAARRAREPLACRGAAGVMVRYRPLGVIAAVTPWNNPVGIPIGKIAPALLYGNTVVWKPAPAGSRVAIRVMEMWKKAGGPPGVVNLVCGDRSTALALMSDPLVNAATLSGSVAAGYAAQDVCALRHIPLQAELGGNNVALVWPDCDLRQTAGIVAEAAFGFAGQRCTSLRRVILPARGHREFLDELQPAVAALGWGDPLEPKTLVGPLIHSQKREDVAALIERSRRSAGAVLTPHQESPAFGELHRKGSYFPPTIVCCDDPNHEIVQEETFGPVLVVQRAKDFDHALHLCNGVRQGLIAALFSQSRDCQARFLDEAQAGILRVNAARTDVDAEVPFGGWKASGVGPPEHGASNREFYTRTQTVYRGWRG